MKRLTRYVYHPVFGVTAGVFILLALIFAFANIFRWLPPSFQLGSLIIRSILGVLVLGTWVLLNIQAPKFTGFIIAIADLVEERDAEGALYGQLRKSRRNLLSSRDYSLDPEDEGDSKEALFKNRFVQEYLRNRRNQPSVNLPPVDIPRALPSGQNQSLTNLTTNPPRPLAFTSGAADASPESNLLDIGAEAEEERLPVLPKKFDPPATLAKWKEVSGSRMLTTHLMEQLKIKLADAQLTKETQLNKERELHVTLFKTDVFVGNRGQALREAEYPKARAVIWGWNIYGTPRDFVPVVELTEPFENRREQHGQVQILGLKSFDLGRQTAKNSTTFSAFVSGLGAYALEQYEKARSEFSLALISAYMHNSNRKNDLGIDRAIIYFFLGNTRYYLGDFENAVSSYREALTLDPNMYEARHNLGISLLLQGKMDFAIKRLVEVIQSKPGLAVARYNLGMAYLKKKQYVKARDQLQNSIKLNEHFAAAFRAIGLSYSEEQVEDEARSYFRDALILDPRFAEVHVDLALLYYRKVESTLKKIRELRKVEQSRDQTRIQEARDELKALLRHSQTTLMNTLNLAMPELEKALEINQRLPEALFHLGQVLHDQCLIKEEEDLKDQALHYLQEAVRLRPAYADAHEELADIYEARYRYDLRDRHLKLMGEARSATSATNPKDLIRAAIGMRLNKQLPEAREALVKALRMDPRNTEGQFELGLVYQEMDEASQAMGMFQSVLRLPNPPDEVYEAIAKIYRQQGQEQEAFDSVQRAAAQKPTSAKLAYYLGNSFRRQQNNPRAIEAYQKAINLDPQLPDARFNLGLIYLGKHQLQDASLQFEEVVRQRPDDFTTYRYLGRAYVDMKQIDEAVTAFQKAIEIKDDAVEARLDLGQIYLTRMEADEAKEQFEAILKSDPNNMRARELLGKAFAQGGQIDMAMETFQNMLLIAPDSYAAHYNLGVAYVSENRYQDAAAEFQRVIQVKPDDAAAYFNLGLAHDKLDQPNEAIDSFLRAIKLRPSYAEAYHYLGQVYFKINRMEDGLKAVKYAEQLKHS
ncbi:MAG: tetratricopeptide repeat protein [Chloroflexi bacterium]|nr:tetratricopeptide repeat protein [Chloroflexota bacterium]